MDKIPDISDLDKMEDSELEKYAYGMGVNTPDMSEVRGLLLEMTPSKTGPSMQESDSEQEIPGVIGANMISSKNGLPTVEGLRTISGWDKPFKGSHMKRCMEKLNEYHQNMNRKVTVSDMSFLEEAETTYRNLLKEVSKFVQDAQKGHAILHGKEAAAMLPAMSSLLMKLYSIGNVFDKGEWIVYDYMMEHRLKSVRLGLALTGRLAQSVQGNMVSTKEDSGQIDRTALQKRKKDEPGRKKPENEKEIGVFDELTQRRLPSVGDADAVAQLQRILVMLSDIELQAEDDVARHAVRVRFFDITKMIHLLVTYPELMTKEGAEALAVQQGISHHEKQDYLNTYQYYSKVQGMTLGDASTRLDEIRMSQAVMADKDSISAGGGASTVLIDKNRNMVLRTNGNGAGNVQEQRKKSNFNYDEAFSRLAEVTGIGSIAGARTTYFIDKNDNLQYGTNMDKAEGAEAEQTKFSFGSKKADSQMKAGRHNIFGHKDEEELKKNAGMIISSFKMQILDYLGLHNDRHTANFFIDMDAENPEQAFTGIDNDFAFGSGTSRTEEDRAVSYRRQAQGAYDDKANENRTYGDLMSNLAGFACIPVETAKTIQSLNVEAIRKAMMPYLDRASVFSVLRRVRALKEYAENAKIVDVKTAEGMDEFRQATLQLMVRTLMENPNNVDLLIGSGGGGGRMAPSILARMLLLQYFTSGVAAKKEGSDEYKYLLEQEYITDNTSISEYFGVGVVGKNKGIREQKWWNSLDGIIEEAGMTREQVWNTYAKQLPTEKEEDFAKRKEEFIQGKMNLVFW